MINPDTIVYAWDTPAHCYHNTRVKCDLAGLSLIDKNTICQCIYQESRFETQVEGRANSNGTHDWGICQFNDGEIHGVPLWIGPGAAFTSTVEVLANPEKCVEVMIAEFKVGHINWWSSYSTGAYKQWGEPNSPMWDLANQV